MKKIAIIIGILLVLPLVLATGFSPTRLNYNLNVGEEDCKNVRVDSASPTITVSDKWAADENVEEKVSLYETSASEHGLSLSYDDELDLDEREVEVCLSGNKAGEYHGVLLLREEQQGNSIVQMGIWLKATIGGNEEDDGVLAGNEEVFVDNSGGGSSKSEKESDLLIKGEAEEQEFEIEKLSDVEEEGEIGITGNVIFGENRGSRIAIILAVLAIIGIIIYRRFR